MNCGVCRYWAREGHMEEPHHRTCPVGAAARKIIHGWHQAEDLAMQAGQQEQTEEAYNDELDRFLSEIISECVEQMYNPTRK